MKIVNYTKVLRATIEVEDYDIKNIRDALHDRSEFIHNSINAHDEISLDRKKELREELQNLMKMMDMFRDLANS